MSITFRWSGRQRCAPVLLRQLRNGSTVAVGSVGMLLRLCPFGETVTDRGQRDDRTPLHAQQTIASQPERAAMIVLRVPRMTSRRSVRAVTASLRDLPGVETIQADSSAASLVVEGTVSERDVRIMLANLGFAADGQSSAS
jgi:Heavy-metal-associated domain